MLQTNKKHFTHFYRTLDGTYSSFWIGKLIASLTKKGKISVVEKQANTLWLTTKTQGKDPLSFVLECLLKIKPTFNLGSVVTRGKEKQYPMLLSYSKQLQLANRWVSSLIVERKERSLSQRMYSELLSIDTDKRHVLTQRRDKVFKVIMKNRANLRFSK